MMQSANCANVGGLGAARPTIQYYRSPPLLYQFAYLDAHIIVPHSLNQSPFCALSFLHMRTHASVERHLLHATHYAPECQQRYGCERLESDGTESTRLCTSEHYAMAVRGARCTIAAANTSSTHHRCTAPVGRRLSAQSQCDAIPLQHAQFECCQLTAATTTTAPLSATPSTICT